MLRLWWLFDITKFKNCSLICSLNFSYLLGLQSLHLKLHFTIDTIIYLLIVSQNFSVKSDLSCLRSRLYLLENWVIWDQRTTTSSLSPHVHNPKTCTSLPSARAYHCSHDHTQNIQILTIRSICWENILMSSDDFKTVFGINIYYCKFRWCVSLADNDDRLVPAKMRN